MNTAQMTRRELGPESSDDLVARANAYALLSRALSPPGNWEGSLVRGLRESFRPLGQELERLATELADAIESAMPDRQPLDVAFAKLFLGPFEIEAPPYASLYLDPEGRLMGSVSQAAVEAYSEAGLGPSTDRPREVPDHITHELEFMYFLVFEEAQTGAPVWRSRASSFWTSHLGLWLPDFAARLAQASRHSVYDLLAALLSRFAQEEESVYAWTED